MPSYCWICRKYLKTDSMDKRLRHMEIHGYDNEMEEVKHEDNESGSKGEVHPGFGNRVDQGKIAG